MSARVIITGASGGIGSATVAELRRRGAEVVGLDLAADEEAGVLACDVTDQGSIDAAVAASIDQLGGLDVLINCAGIGVPQSATTAPTDEDLAVIEINLIGPWRVTAAAIDALRRSRGRVINVASGLAHLTMPFSTAYCMSKRGLTSYSDALRLELRGEVSVTTVYPGYIRTKIHERAAEDGLTLEGTVPAEDVSDAVSALVRASLKPDPPRDLATTRAGTINYAMLRLVPRSLVDRLIELRTRRLARKGHFDQAGMAADYVRKARSGTRV